MGISALSTVNSINTKQRMSLSGRGPDWSIIPSSGKSSKSKVELTDEIKELARKAANTTSKAELEYIHRRRTELCAEYMSDVSPDRKALYRQAENALKEQGSNPKCKGSGELTLLYFLEAADGRMDNLAEKKFTLAGGRNADLSNLDRRGTWRRYLLPGYKGADLSRFGIRVGLREDSG